jgi:hypothetical protein
MHTATDRTTRMKVPLFGAVIRRLNPTRRWVVLDLGAASTGTLGLLGRFGCRVDVADIAGAAIEELNAEKDPRRIEKLAESLLPRRRDEPTDFVLCWDLFDYLNKRSITALMAQVAARQEPLAMAHALVEYSARSMPACPRHYTAVDETHLEAMTLTNAERETPRYSHEDLALAVPDYTIDRAVLLGNGMQEFLLERRA